MIMYADDTAPQCYLNVDKTINNSTIINVELMANKSNFDQYYSMHYSSQNSHLKNVKLLFSTFSFNCDMVTCSQSCIRNKKRSDRIIADIL